MSELDTCTVDGIYLEKLLRLHNMVRDAQKRHDSIEVKLGRYPQCSCELCCILEKAMKRGDHDDR